MVFPITACGGEKSTFTSRAAQASASIETSIPGASTAAYVLARRRDDVEVRGRPKSTTMQGRRSARAATAFAIRSGPTSRGRRRRSGYRSSYPGRARARAPRRSRGRSRAHGGRDNRGEADARDVLEAEVAELEQPADENGVRRRPRPRWQHGHGRPVAVVQSEDRLRVADVDGQQQGELRLELLFFAAERLAELLRERFGVSMNPSPRPGASS